MVAGAFVIRSEAEIWQAVQLYANNPSLSIRFENYPKLVVAVEDGIDAISRAEALLALRTLVQRHYCLLKYGTTRLSRLTKVDRSEVKLLVDETDRTKLIVDFSKALNACAKVVEEHQQEAAGPEPRQCDWFSDMSRSAMPEPGQTKETGKFAATRDVAVELIRSVPMPVRAGFGILGILVFGVWLCGPDLLTRYFQHDEAVRKQADTHQLEMAQLSRPAIVAENGQAVRVPPKVQAALEDGIHDDHDRTSKILTTDRPERPLVRFVSDEVGSVFPALFDLAVAGPIDINGVKFPDAKAAKRAARGAAAKPPIVTGWEPTVRRLRKPSVPLHRISVMNITVSIYGL